jgi:hypothetical protein
MSSKDNSEELFANYDWDAILEWAKFHSTPQQKEDEALVLEEQFEIIDEIEIKQEIVLDPNE